MDLDNLVIRNATKDDINQIVSIKVNGWKNAYIGIVSDEYLNNLSVSDEIIKYNNKYFLNDIYVAEINGEIFGFCRVYDYDSPKFEDKAIDCEIREIYIRPDIKRMGIGGKLFNYVLSSFKTKNKKKLYLGVFADNYKSRKFYEKFGGMLWKSGYLEIDGIKYSTVSYLYNLKN